MASTQGYSSSRKWTILAVAGLAYLVSGFSTNSLNIALPAIAAEFGIEQSSVSWIILVYSLTSCCTLLFFGRLADIYGHKRLFAAGFFLFGATSLLTPLISKRFVILVACRCLLGIAFSVLNSIAIAVAQRPFPPKSKATAISAVTAFFFVGAALGPTVGGLIVTYISWRWLFFICVPLCALGFILTLLFIPPDENEEEAKPLDIIGSVLLVIAVGGLILGLNQMQAWGLGSVRFFVCILLALAAFAAFFLYERQCRHPIIKIELFRDLRFVGFNLANTGIHVCHQIVLYLVPLYLINVALLSADRAGLMMLVLSVSTIIASPFVGRVADAAGYRKPCLFGALLMMGSMLCLSILGEGLRYGFLLFSLVIQGAGMACCVSTINASTLGASPCGDEGMVSGLAGTVRNIGLSLGVALANVIISAQSQTLSGELADTAAYLRGQQSAFFVGFTITIITFLLTFSLPNKRRL